MSSHQCRTSTHRKPRHWRLILVGNLSFSKRQAKMETFKGTCLCETRSPIASTVEEIGVVRTWEAPLTVYPPGMSESHCHLSEISDCSITPSSKRLHPSIISSSHTHNLLLQLHASPPSSQPSAQMWATVLNLFVAKSNNRANCLQKGTSSNHLSNQKKVFFPSPNTFDTLYANKPPPSSPTPSLIFAISFHQEETLQPPTSNLLPPRHISPPTLYTKTGLYPPTASSTIYLIKLY